MKLLSLMLADALKSGPLMCFTYKIKRQECINVAKLVISRQCHICFLIEAC